MMLFTQHLPSYSKDSRFYIRRSQHIALCQKNTTVNPTNEDQTQNVDGDDNKRQNHSEFNIILLGATGSGKSSAGNVLLNNPKAFKTSLFAKSETKTSKVKCIIRTRDNQNYNINIFDTPAALNTGLTNEEIEDGMKLLENKTIHAYVFCIPAIAMTKYYIDDIKHYEKRFGSGFYKLIITAFTRYDKFEPDIKKEDRKKSFESKLSHAIDYHSTVGKMFKIKSNYILISEKATEGGYNELDSVIEKILKNQNSNSCCIL